MAAAARKAKTQTPQPQLPLDDPIAAKIKAKLDVIGEGVAKKKRGRPPRVIVPRVTLPGEENPLVKERRMAYWNDLMMGVPNDLVRCAIFTATECDQRRALADERIASHENIIVTYTGWQLGQSHLDVFEGVMQLLRGQASGSKVNFNRNELLSIIGRDNSGFQYAWVDRKITDIAAGLVKIIKNKKKGFMGSLIEGGEFDTVAGTYSVRMNDELIRLFDEGFTKVDWAQRKALTGKPLACWLHMYYCSHKKPFPVTVEFLMNQCGSTTAEVKHFRPNLVKALDQIVEVGVIDGWEIAKDGIVTVKKPIVSRKKAS